MKRNSFLGLLALLILLLSCNNEEVSFNNNTSYSIILIMGQSNTHFGIGLNSELDSPSENIYQLGRFNDENMQIIIANEPLQHHTESDNKIGFGLTFAKLLKDHLNDDTNILIIPCGSGGTGFRDNRWNKGDDLYNDAVERVNTVISQYPTSEVVSILWHQGERDVGNSNYETRLNKFITDIRADLAVNNVPFILGGMVPFWVNQDNERVIQQEIIARAKDNHSFVGYANPEIPFLIEKENNSFDQIHYDATGQRELGRRYFSEFLNLIEE